MWTIVTAAEKLAGALVSPSFLFLFSFFLSPSRGISLALWGSCLYTYHLFLLFCFFLHSFFLSPPREMRRGVSIGGVYGPTSE